MPLSMLPRPVSTPCAVKDSTRIFEQISTCFTANYAILFSSVNRMNKIFRMSIIALLILTNTGAGALAVACACDEHHNGSQQSHDHTGFAVDDPHHCPCETTDSDHNDCEGVDSGACHCAFEHFNPGQSFPAEANPHTGLSCFSASALPCCSFWSVNELLVRSKRNVIDTSQLIEISVKRLPTVLRL